MLECSLFRGVLVAARVPSSSPRRATAVECQESRRARYMPLAPPPGSLSLSLLPSPSLELYTLYTYTHTQPLCSSVCERAGYISSLENFPPYTFTKGEKLQVCVYIFTRTRVYFSYIYGERTKPYILYILYTRRARARETEERSRPISRYNQPPPPPLRRWLSRRNAPPPQPPPRL